MISPLELSREQAARIWIQAQKLHETEPFGSGPGAVEAAIQHLGYVQIDTIHVIERAHHHLLYTRIPRYKRSDLRECQSQRKSIFEYWTHALSYVPVQDFPIYRTRMTATKNSPSSWFRDVKPEDLKRVLKNIRTSGPLCLDEFQDEPLREKTHLWASRKPAQKALQLAFYRGDLAVSERLGIRKKFDLLDRHFGWSKRPTAATATQSLEHRLAWGLRAQGLVSLESLCFLAPALKPRLSKLIEKKVISQDLLPVRIKGLEKQSHWIRRELYESLPQARSGELRLAPSAKVHLLSPFDPLVIQRSRLAKFLEFDYRFEAYLPPAQRVRGYFALPVLDGEKVVATLDLKTDRQARRLRMQKWVWNPGCKSPETKRRIEEALTPFESFQLDF